MQVPAHTYRLGIISNPLSGRNKKRAVVMTTILEAHPDILHDEVHTQHDIQTTLTTFAQEQVNVLVINGGDGTVQAVLTTLFHLQPFATLPLLAILPSGTSNMNAGDVGLRGNRTASLQKLLSWIEGHGPDPTLLTRHVLRVQRVPDEDPIFGMFFGAGAIYQGAQVGWKTKQSVGRLGEVGASLIICRFFLSLLFSRQTHITPIHATISRDEHPAIKGEFLTILVTTLERLFLGLRPYWGTESHPLHYTAVRKSPAYLMRTLPSLLFGRTHKYGTAEHGYDSHNALSLELHMQDGFTIDGEDYTSDPERGPVRLTTGGIATFIRF
ncbi:diacylglycerol/lipid kinase family protein [Nitrospira sp. M1]